MSWNPRRFAAAASEAKSQACGMLLWMTVEAQDRIASAIDERVLEFTSSPIPDEGLFVGLAEPVQTSRGEVSMIWVAGQRDLWILSQRLFAEHRPRSPEFFDRVMGDSPIPRSPFGLVYAFSTRGQCVASAAFHLDTWADLRSKDGVAELSADLCEELGLQERLLLDDSSEALLHAVRAAWTVLNDPVEAEVSAMTVFSETVTTGKKRKRAEHEVAVIDVRRRHRPSSDPVADPVEHDHRWEVRGHWRMQPFGPGRAERRRIWIDAHLAGPEDKPLRSRTKVHLLR